MKEKTILIQQLVGLVLEVNTSDKNHFCEMFIEPNRLEVLYYAQGHSGDETDEFVVKIHRDNFGEKIDLVIDFLKEVLEPPKEDVLRPNTEGCDGYCRSYCCDANIDLDMGLCFSCHDHSDTACSQCEDKCEDYRTV